MPGLMHSGAIVCALALLAGCTAGPDHVLPSSVSAAQFVRAGGADHAAPVARWWEGLADPQLSALVEQALADAPTLAAAEARVRQAREGVAGSRANLLPVLLATTNYIHADLPGGAFGGGATGFYAAGFDARWEADLWGGKRREVEAREAEAGIAAARLADAQVSLSAEIVRSYVALQARLASMALIDERAGHESRLEALAQQRLAGGTGTRQQMAVLRQRTARTAAERAAVAAEANVLRDALATLSGKPPGSFDTLGRTAVPLPPEMVAIGDPAALLMRRPDVIAAERRLAAASAAIGVAEARRFPQVSLLGLIGLGGSTADGMSNGLDLASAALPGLSWSFLDFGRTAAAVSGAKAGRDAALAEYDAAVLAALGDAEAALTRFGAERTRLRQAGVIAREGDVAARLQGMRADAGTISRSDGLEAEIAAIDARLAEVNGRAGLTLAYAALAKSLGLGWMPATDGPR